MSEGVEVIAADSGPVLDLVSGDGRAWAVVWPGSGARLRSIHRVSLGGGASTRAMSHPGEAVYYVSAGAGAVLSPPEDTEVAVVYEGSMVHVGPGTAYSFKAGRDGMELVGGPSPPDGELYRGLLDGDFAPGDTAPAEGSAPEGASGGVTVHHRDSPDRMLPMIASDARLVVWPGVGAETANMNFVDMKAGEENVPHSHAFSEDTIVILEGRGTISDLTNLVDHEFEAGSVIHVPAGVEHQVRADRGESVVSVGGPCPADVPMLRAAGALP